MCCLFVSVSQPFDEPVTCPGWTLGVPYISPHDPVSDDDTSIVKKMTFKMFLKLLNYLDAVEMLRGENKHPELSLYCFFSLLFIKHYKLGSLSAQQ